MLLVKFTYLLRAKQLSQVCSTREFYWKYIISIRLILVKLKLLQKHRDSGMFKLPSYLRIQVIIILSSRCCHDIIISLLSKVN
jgi:hypothetical protein